MVGKARAFNLSVKTGDTTESGKPEHKPTENKKQDNWLTRRTAQQQGKTTLNQAKKKGVKSVPHLHSQVSGIHRTKDNRGFDFDPTPEKLHKNGVKMQW